MIICDFKVICFFITNESLGKKLYFKANNYPLFYILGYYFLLSALLVAILNFTPSKEVLIFISSR